MVHGLYPKCSWCESEWDVKKVPDVGLLCRPCRREWNSDTDTYGHDDDFDDAFGDEYGDDPMDGYPPWEDSF